ncbi:hypothetical protein [Hirschia baltica]|uniref:Uncharacterized protein n=1 Tax=Hirschia baltica (strain ATCC 49814 / DSM 5838 / IFAM 1418) TaxID=582402 RepID=C6XIS9_HIRBI|nr:hypothetical protein [Hirschia baltica]ACT59024.1 hypothetical protein Hbal_1332 [Hirschia baltica ATCC 49814]
MTFQLRNASKFFIVSVSALALAGTAHAGSCSSMQKELVNVGNEIVGMQADREEIVATFELHNNERAAAKAELANLETGVIKMTKDEKAGYEASVEEHHAQAEEAKSKLELMNVSLMEKAEAYNEKTTAFNTKCIG